MNEKLFAFCVRFAKQYPTLSNGIHIVRYKGPGFMITRAIEIKPLLKECDFYPTNSNPVRFNKENLHVEIAPDLNYHFSVILFLVIWAFIRENCKDDIQTDKKALDILINHKIKMSNRLFVKDFIKLSADVFLFSSNTNQERFNKLIDRVL
jgi:hypothetical protein